MDRAGVNPLNNAQHFRTRARCDEKAAATTIGFNQLWMMWIEFKDRELRRRTGRIRHKAQSQVAGELMLILSVQFLSCERQNATLCDRSIAATNESTHMT
jgi:hypothetical protein